MRVRTPRRRAERLAVALVLLAFFVPTLLPAGPVAPASGQNLPAYAAGEVLVKFRPSPAATIAAAIRESDAAEVEQIARIGVRRLRGTRGQSAEALVEKFKRHPLVEFAEVNGFYTVATIPNDPLFPNQWAPGKIKATQAWDVTIGSPDGVVAVLDTGIDYLHPDFAGKVLLGPDYVQGDKDPRDDNGHGTAVAGVALADTNNAAGIAGLNWLGKVLAIKVCDQNAWCLWSAVSQGITYAADNGAKVISISIIGSVGSSTLQSALQYAWNKGLVISCSAGNGGTNGPAYPADYSECIKVGATDSGDNRASWSNYGSKLEVMAPGVNVLTTTRGGGYGAWNGTSFSAPYVAALASLLFAQNLQLSNSQVRDIMKSTAQDLGAVGWDEYYGYGRIDAYAAVLQAGSTPPPPPPPPPTTDYPPTVSITSPAAGSSLSGRVQITAQASDDVGVARVEFWVDGELIATSTASPYAATWNTRPKKWSPGLHTIKAIAVDTSGKTATALAEVTLAK